MTDEPTIRDRISELIAAEHALRDQLTNGEVGEEEEHARLAALEVELDQLWDLLRQRRARSENGQDPDAAEERGAATVEGYLQ